MLLTNENVWELVLVCNFSHNFSLNPKGQNLQDPVQITSNSLQNRRSIPTRNIKTTTFSLKSFIIQWQYMWLSRD